jgi:hypothetical protein
LQTKRDELLFRGLLRATTAGRIIAIAMEKAIISKIFAIAGELYDCYFSKMVLWLIQETVMAGLLSLGLRHKGIQMW